VAPAAGRHFEQSVRHREGGRDYAHLGIGEPHFLLNGLGRLPHADAIEIENDAKQAEEEKNAVAHMGLTFIRIYAGAHLWRPKRDYAAYPTGEKRTSFYNAHMRSP